MSPFRSKQWVLVRHFRNIADLFKLEVQMKKLIVLAAAILAIPSAALARGSEAHWGGPTSVQPAFFMCGIVDHMDVLDENPHWPYHC